MTSSTGTAAASPSKDEHTMEGQRAGRRSIDCPYCGERHDYKMAKPISNGGGIVNVLQSLPCGNRILAFVTESGEIRGYEKVVETNALIFFKDDSPVNYNQSYKLFTRTKGLASKVTSTAGPGNDGT